MISNTDKRSLRILSWFLLLMVYLCFVPNQIHAETLPAYRTGWHWPTNASEDNRWISRGRYENSALHDAIDITAGNEIRASRDGVVEYVFKGCSNVNGYGEGRTCTDNNCASKDSFPYCGYCNAGSGNGVVLRHEIDGETYYSAYSHMVENSIPNNLVKGTVVKAGDKLGIMGASGMAAGVHLHFNIYSDYLNNISINVNPVDISNKVKISTTDTSGLMLKNGYVYDINGINYVTSEINHTIREISVVPNKIDFGPQYIGLDAPIRRTITITNSGTINITLNTNIHSENFIVESFSKTELSPGESATALVSFKCELPIGIYEETVNIQAVGNEDGQTVSVPLELKMESAYFEIPDRLSCESCFSKHTRIDKGQAYSYRNTEPIYNGDGTHTAEMSHYYQVICLDCGTESEMILSDSSIVSQDCIYNDQGICYICESSFLDCTHGMENYERVRWEHVYYTPTYSNETYHWQPYMLFYYYECSICGTEVIQSNQSNQREEVHYYHADGRCACGAEGEPSTCRHEDPRYSKIVEENVRYEDITAETHMKIADQYALEWCVDCGEMCSRDLWKKSVVTVEGHSPVGGVCACGYRSEDISVYPDTIDFGVQYIGEEMPFRRLITITNSGTTDIELNTNVQSEYFIVESFSKEKLSSGESATAVVLFKVGMPAGACEEIVNIEATNDHLQTVVSIPLKLKIQHILIEMPLNPLCEYCQSDNTEVRSHWMIHDAVYNGDSTHTMDCSYCYLVNCLNCHEEYQKTLNRSTMSSFCGYSDQGVCYTCGHTYLACTHGKENYVKTGYEIEKYTPVFKDENYHFLPGTFFWCYECSICGAKARESYASTSEEEHYHYADGMCACGYKIGCKTHEFVNGVCSICGRPDLHSLNATLTLPANIKNIEMGAFTGSAAEAVIVPDGCLTIGERAFAQSEALKCVVLPGSVIEIAEDAFEGCVDLVIFAPQNSAAHIYAQKYGYIWYEK